MRESVAMVVGLAAVAAAILGLCGAALRWPSWRTLLGISAALAAVTAAALLPT